MDVLILTAFFGAGHYTVSKAIREQLMERDSTLDVQIQDLFSITNPIIENYAYDFYNFITREMPEFYNFFYNRKKDIPDFYIDEITSIIGLQKFAEYVKVKRPRVIISTFPICSNVVSRFKKKYKSQVPLVTCITDVVDSWEWVSEETDRYFVPAGCVRDGLVKKGVEPGKISVTGIPLRRSFMKFFGSQDSSAFAGVKGEYVPDGSEGEIKPDNGLCENRVLVMGGGRGLFEIGEEVFDYLAGLESVKTTIITGKNRELYDQLRSRGFKSLEVMGYVHDPAQVIRESSIIITKPGGVTLFESISCETPVVCREPHIGQEIQNAGFIENMGIGMVRGSADEIIRGIESAIENPCCIQDMKRSIINFKKTLRPFEVTSSVIELMDRW
ncbi:processive 1,2-diacylglycerol beta-glucosyltransferase [Peptoclostridium litorale DSM 5388]|uniref:Processive diacylglycerol beta-glucosyltransferase UgtP n=1 Tax=Peptoclostridium litorale DSM 5388 TaxID=1121324 RepID=A0A069RL55_PEPLI|nr:glycosyltransferase [Peptoclostridium litorale]KDR94947.1 processive diacylglycerol beta-glucosyltransferase UgtP [Peptoclostridium litorale DSM 5388]SIO33941.1 processive 1,2-diacylglycerol beta-glucosyltransferase [Peptoclostridium litorale DSM 5388]